ncbi:hypothetical protein [Serratia fonticola]|uniref:Uncharacterized protein n=1 Tax=Serratia fonticola TaxID=47917 RepID=A0AAW3WRR9_SERFO|nr:hypothetical protein [Serratia fonticola]MBC3213429.1 hypothetical protein [Serratia fonticola]NYA14288.1 hypothetical protein [Serratia fonticola]NYA33930.1 hypothetical protein [Serratia fonticola]
MTIEFKPGTKFKWNSSNEQSTVTSRATNEFGDTVVFYNVPYFRRIGTEVDLNAHLASGEISLM